MAAVRTGVADDLVAMSIPPQIIRVKRKKEDSPLDTLRIPSSSYHSLSLANNVLLDFEADRQARHGAKRLQTEQFVFKLEQRAEPSELESESHAICQDQTTIRGLSRALKSGMMYLKISLTKVAVLYHLRPKSCPRGWKAQLYLSNGAIAIHHHDVFTCLGSRNTQSLRKS